MKERVLAILQQPAGYKSYNARSGEIYGILKTMKEEFEGSLAKTQKEEAEAQQRFEELIAEKKAGIEKARERKNTKVTEKSDLKTCARASRRTRSSSWTSSSSAPPATRSTPRARRSGRRSSWQSARRLRSSPATRHVTSSARRSASSR